MKNRIIIASVIIFAAIYALIAEPECIFLKYFHIICPGCGMTRAVKSLIQLDFRQAFIYHPMIYSIPVLILYIIKNGRPVRNNFINYSVLIMIGLGFSVNYIVKLYITVA